MTEPDNAAPGGAGDPAHGRTAGGTVTIEALVRRQLAQALGGRRGIIEAAVPTASFTVCWVATHQLKLSLIVSAVLAVALLLARIVQRQTVQFVLNAVIGVAVASAFALHSGNAADAFLPGLLYNAGYAVALTVSVLVRWPIVGFLIGAVTGAPTEWHRDRALVRLCSRLTLVLALPCFIRVAVQYPLYHAGEAGWLGFAKLAMGWPLQIAALAVMAWMLGRNTTEVTVRPGSWLTQSQGSPVERAE